MKFIFILFLLIPFENFAQKITDPVEYHEFFELVQVTASKQIYAIPVMIKQQETTAENLAEYRSTLMETFGQVIADLNEIGGFDGNDELNKATRELVEFYKKMVTDHYDQYIQFFSNENSGEDSKLMDLISGLVDEETKLRSAYFGAESTFAKRYGIGQTED